MLKHFFHIIRWPNLAMIAIVQLLIYLILVDTGTSVVDLIDFMILSLITMLIAGAGYIINDYYDHKMDEVNKPDKWIAGNIWSLDKVKTLYWIVVATGAALSIWLALRLELLPFLFIYPIAVAALWLYSYSLKCMPVIGNLWVSIFCAGVVLVVPLPDWLNDNFLAISNDLWYYAVFAFLATWYREIVKDIEDCAGDRSAGCSTFAVRFGTRASKLMALVIVILLIIAVYRWTNIQSNGNMEIALNILQGFIITSMTFVWWAKDKTYYRAASLLIKVVMLLGTIVLLLL